MANSDSFDDDDESSLFSGDLGPLDTGFRQQFRFPGGSGFTPMPGVTLRRDEEDTPSAGFPPTNHPAIRQPDDIELMGTKPLDDAPRPEFPPVSPLFQERYGNPGNGPSAHDPQTPNLGQRPSLPEASVPVYARQRGEGPQGAALQQRRAEDERMTGRHWPGNSIIAPGSPFEAAYFEDLAIALGQVDPRLLAREGALRYVRSAVIPGEDELGPTDIYAILYYGLGLTLRPLDCTGLPHVLAVYHRATREVYLDWKLLSEPPYGRAIFDPAAWRRSVDGSLLARFLLSWCAAVHLTDNYDVPLVLGFSPVGFSAAPLAGPSGGSIPPSLPADTLNRYRKAMIAAATVLAPADRLWQQVTALRLRIHMGDPEWRNAMRAEYGYSGGRGTGAPAMDPAEQLISVLAERNNCPPLLVEAQLDGNISQMDWTMWSTQLLRDIPELQLRYAASAHMFRMSGASQAAGWGAPSRGHDPAPVQVQLSL
ncbi:MAG: hypothetical protein ACRDHP_06860 [Ktedonobacterales bacterium]